MGYVPPPRPSGIITFPKGITYQQFEAFRSDFRRLYGLPARPVSGRPSMDFYHFMNTGLLFSMIALVLSVLYLGLTTA